MRRILITAFVCACVATLDAQLDRYVRIATPVADVTAPTTTITAPDSDGTYDAGTTTPITVSGGAADNVVAVTVAWSCDNGQAGTADVSAGAWSAGAINMSGSSPITCTAAATDSSNNTDASPASIAITWSGGGADPNLIIETDFEDCAAVTINSTNYTISAGKGQGDSVVCAINDGIKIYNYQDTPGGQLSAIINDDADCHGSGSASAVGDCFRQWLGDGYPNHSGALKLTASEVGITNVTTMYISYWLRYKNNGQGGPGWRSHVSPSSNRTSTAGPQWHKQIYINVTSGVLPIHVIGCGSSRCGSQPVNPSAPWVYNTSGGTGTTVQSWDTVFNDDAWHRVESYIVSGSSGSEKTCYDGVLTNNKAIDWTSSGGSGGWEFIEFGSNVAYGDQDEDPTTDSTSASTEVEMFFDDLYWSRDVPAGACASL